MRRVRKEVIMVHRFLLRHNEHIAKKIQPFPHFRSESHATNCCTKVNSLHDLDFSYYSDKEGTLDADLDSGHWSQ